MRANVTEYDLIAPATLTAALATLAEGRHTLIAGGTELMVALSAGRLPKKPLLSINHFSELRFMDVTPETITIGSGTTFTDLRRHPMIASDFPLLSQAASWTGSIANQNRGTLGGNIVNASPAADSPPALLAYDAELTLISTAGRRTMPYRDFYLGYKKTALRPDELLHSITLKRIFHGYISYTRKVGTRNAQAISKVAIAALARMKNGFIEDIRIGAASLREFPIRLTAAETILTGKPINAAAIAAARAALFAETRPIDDIRSTSNYRSIVAANLLEEFLQSV
ncbi:FAD binding domain-containing protein [Granulicella arctica]|uniref:CO/xanthine dehydrogenase FAD-binding subunit n=1 Tax=Granulicella arctica TaxID=940613 RepID=A0A7Y9TH15_9BACT|nr:FAD binding domain-containing protein [Granulicella arctica]NYF79390.1 CO/xanthine dehydrogenase FAD-binding subunit [Granulicella arctica]